MKEKIYVILAILLLLGLATSVWGIEECGRFPDHSFDSPEMNSHSGVYENPNYLYSVTIPKGLTGHSAPPPSPHHGFGIVLSWEPRAYLWVDSSSNSLFYKTASEASAIHVDTLKDQGSIIRTIKKRPARLGKNKAIDTLIKYTCPKTKENRIVLIRSSLRSSLVDQVSLDTTETRFNKDKKIFESIVASWKITGKY